MTISDMRSNPTAMAYNRDIISKIERPGMVMDSFATIKEPISVVWNITNECSYKCEICATFDPNRTELDIHQKMAALSNIASK